MSESLNAKVWLILSAVSALIFLLNIDYTAVNLALVSISEEIPADLNTFQWLLSGYVLTWAAFVVPAGRFADRAGKGKMLIIGVSLFIAGSLLTGLGHRIDILIAGRILQGIGAAIFTPPCYGLIFDTMPPQKRSFGMGILAGVAGLGLAAGPTCAGYLIYYLSWRWIFYINIPLGLLVILAVVLFVPKDSANPKAPKVDPLGSFLLAAGLGLFMFGLNQIEIWGIQDLKLLSMIAAGVTALILFWLFDRKQKNQTMPRHFFKNKPFMSALLAVTLNVYNFSLILVMMGLYLQNTLHYSGYEAGIIFLAMTLAIGLLSPIGGKIGDKVDIRYPIIAGFLCLALSTFLMSLLDGSSSVFTVLIALLFAGIGLGLSWPTLNAAMMRAVEPHEINTASALFTMATMVANTLGVIVSTSLVVMFGQSKLTALLSAKNITLLDDQNTILFSAINQVEHTAKQLADLPEHLIPELLTFLDASFVYGLTRDMWIGGALSLLGCLLVLKGLKNLKSASTTADIPVIVA